MTQKFINMQPITVLGAGSWGTALALHLSKLGQTVRLWAYDKQQAEIMRAERVNKTYLPDHHFPASLHPTSELAEAIDGAEDILIAVPSFAFKQTLQNLKIIAADKPLRFISATKGLDPASGQLLHEIAINLFGKNCLFAALAGPSFAREVAAGLPTAVMIASQDNDFNAALFKRFNSKLFRIYLSRDLIGVEICGVVKNILAIATGISDGMQLGANARSALITRGLAEMTRLGIAIGGERDTFTGLAGVGDLVLTCTDNQSRNRRLGLAIGQGKSVVEAEKEIAQVIEGKQNAETISKLAARHQIDMPISAAVWSILSGQQSLSDAMNQLLEREPKPAGY